MLAWAAKAASGVGGGGSSGSSAGSATALTLEDVQRKVGARGACSACCPFSGANLTGFDRVPLGIHSKRTRGPLRRSSTSGRRSRWERTAMRGRCVASTDCEGAETRASHSPIGPRAAREEGPTKGALELEVGRMQRVPWNLKRVPGRAA